MNKNYDVLILIGSILAIVCFFMPWVDMGFFSISGAQYPKWAGAAKSFAETFSGSEYTGSNLLVYLVYLAPLAGGLAIIFRFFGLNMEEYIY